MKYITRGTPAFRKSNFALFVGGFTTFAILYCTQPLMPVLSEEFHISPAVASLSMSLTTMTLAFSMLMMGSLSEAWGRKSIMVFSLFTVSIVMVLTALSPSYHMLLVFRILQGIIMAGLPAIAMAYLGEEIEPNSAGVAMGLYISGNSIGGMGGRIITGMLTDYFNWRTAIIGIGVLGLICSFIFLVLLPRSNNFQPRPLNMGKLIKSLIAHLRNPHLICLYGLAFLFMGSFVTLYNYIGFQLLAPPYSLSYSLVGWIFIVYLVGAFSSVFMGRLVDTYGRHNVMWVVLIVIFLGACITLNDILWVKIFGVAVFTFGFFGGHSIASSWVVSIAENNRAQASSLYLFFYYLGSSISGTIGGVFWTAYGWIGVIGLIMALLLLAVFLTKRLSSIERSC
ncbi:MAG: MFS transporter [Paenibacillaceae bacterium]